MIYKKQLIFYLNILAHYALASRNTDLVIYLLKIMIDVNLPTFDAHNGL